MKVIKNEYYKNLKNQTDASVIYVTLDDNMGLTLQQINEIKKENLS